MQIETISETTLDAAFKALSSAHRREILRVLSEQSPDSQKTCCGQNEICACKFSEHLGLSASTVSHHMSLLLKAELITARKEGAWTYYSLRRENIDRVAAVLNRL